MFCYCALWMNRVFWNKIHAVVTSYITITKEIYDEYAFASCEICIIARKLCSGISNQDILTDMLRVGQVTASLFYEASGSCVPEIGFRTKTLLNKRIMDVNWLWTSLKTFPHEEHFTIESS